MGYLTNSGTGFMKDAVTTVSNVKSYLVNKTGYLVDAIRVGIGDFGQRVLDDGGTVEASAEAAASYREITKDIYDQASLVLFPSGYKDNLLYSHKPVDGSGDFTYTRGTDTATRVNADGLIEKESSGLTDSMPRIDYTGGEPSLLLEPQRTNAVPDSEDFSTSNWEAQSYTLQNNAAVSPEGVSNATKIIPDNGTTNFRIRTSTALNSSGDVFDSVFAKYIEGEFQYIVLASTNPQQRYVFDVKNGTKIGSIGSTSIADENTIIESYGNGWYRLGIKPNQAGNGKFEIYFSDDGTDVIATGDGSKGMYVWGAQVEQGATYPTSYIPTYNASATRAADDCDGAVNASTFNDSEGVLYVELSYLQDGRLAIKNSDSSDQVVIGVSSGNIFYRVKENNTNIITEFTGVSGILNRKIALRYKSGDTSIFIDGVEYNVNTSNYTLSGLNEFLFVSEGGSNTTYGNIKQVLYFPTALSDDDCEALTAL